MLRAIRECSRVVLFNTVAGYGEGARKIPVSEFTLIRQPGELADFLRPHVRGGSFRVNYLPGLYDEQHFEAVCKLLLATRDVVFAIDEVWTYQKPNYSPPYLRTMMLTGRHYGVTLLWTAQRPALTDMTLRSVSTELYVGRLEEQTDLDALKGRIPQNALAELPRLRDRQFVHRTKPTEWTIV